MPVEPVLVLGFQWNIVLQYIMCARDGELFQRRVSILRHLESQNIWRAKTKNREYWAIY